MSEASNAVFLSYASQDTEAVLRIAETLRASGVEVWFDKNELVGGDAWDAKIRGQIASCALFVPVISAAKRTYGKADGTSFLLPVVIDDSRDSEAPGPETFRHDHFLS